MSDWDGTERRHHDSEVLKQIAELRAIMEAHLIEEKQLKPHIKELVDILQKSKGIVLLFKFLLYVGAPVGALVYWIKDHVKL